MLRQSEKPQCLPIVGFWETSLSDQGWHDSSVLHIPLAITQIHSQDGLSIDRELLLFGLASAQSASH